MRRFYIVLEGVISGVIAITLYVAAILKIRDQSGFAFYLTSITFVPEPWRSRLTVIMPMVEVAVASLLLIGFTKRFGQIAAIVLFAVLTGFLIKMVNDPYAPECNCFGLVTMAANAHRSNQIGLVRNIGLLMLSVLALMLSIASRRQKSTMTGDHTTYRHHFLP
jgi:uncharacterized membrane protein YphA (DoxX/SURF4 family)